MTSCTKNIPFQPEDELLKPGIELNKINPNQPNTEDNLEMAIQESDQYDFSWYKNDLKLSSKNRLLTNKVMKTDILSSYTDHTIEGYTFRCEAENKDGATVEDSTTINTKKLNLEIKGVNIFNPGQEPPPRIDVTFNTVNELNPNTASIWQLYFQDNENSEEIFERYSGHLTLTLTEDHIRYEIRKAKGLGMKVITYPVMALTSPSGTNGYHYCIPGSSGWFENYRKKLVKLANLAEEENVDMFCIGSELRMSENKTSEWEKTIQEVKKVFSGEILYSFLTCQTEEINQMKNRSWIKHLDYIGFSSNLETRETNYDPTVSFLTSKYSLILDEMENVCNLHNKKGIITETGARSIDGGTISPRDWNENVMDLQEQADYCEAFMRAVQGRTTFKGVIWNHFQVGGEFNTGTDHMYNYSIIWKPTFNVLKSWFRD